MRIDSEISPIAHQQFQQSLLQLKARSSRVRLYLLCCATFALISALLLFFNQQLIYAFFEISPTIQHLHIPSTASSLYEDIGTSYDSFNQLLVWILWFGLKVVAAIIGASICVHYAKKIFWLKTKIKGFVQHILAWVIAVMLIWAGLSWLQYEMVGQDRQREHYANIVEYQSNIQQSKIYRYLERHHIDENSQAYLLAQTALLHRPADKVLASAYMEKLRIAENKVNFQHYGFRPEQLFIMQQQLSLPITTFAKTIQPKIDRANLMVHYAHWLWIVTLSFFTVLSMILLILNHQLSKRLLYIQQQFKG